MTYKQIYLKIQEKCKKVFYAETSNSLKQKNMLIVSHTLERGGAPLVLLELIPFFQKEYNIIFISISDGNLRKKFLECGLDVFIGNSIDFVPYEPELWNSFDLVLLNTIICYSYLPFFINKDVKVLWWLHEPEILFRNFYDRIPDFSSLSKNIEILSVTDETAKCVKKYYGRESKILHMALRDQYVGEYVRSDNKIRFFMPAKFQAIKGQDILTQAILDLPPEIHNRAEFIFAGAQDEVQPEYYELINKLSIALNSVIMLGEIEKNQVYQWYQCVDCVLAPSRADATPTTIVEGMMFNRLCVCSDATGISHYIKNGYDGFVFPSEDIVSLKKLLIYIVENYESMDKIRSHGREIYLKNFSMAAVESEIKDIILDKLE